MRGFKSGSQCKPHGYAKGGALKGVPAVRRKGHPVAAKKPLVAPPVVEAAGSKGIKPATPVLDKMVSGAMGRGPDQVAAPQGAAITGATPRKMVAARPAGVPPFQGSPLVGLGKR